jgi:iron-sulfur cluster assembly protein
MDTTASSTEVQPTTPSAAPATPKRSIVSITAKAVDQLNTVIKEQGFEGFYVSIRVVPAGCSGLGYDLNLVKESRPGDITWEQSGLKICTDPVSQKYLTGTEMDYVTGETASGFKFQNPNAKSSCGCGTSFST